MNGNSILIDTNVILYLLSGEKTLVPLLENKKIFVSFITELELLSFKNVNDEEQTIIKRFLAECLVIDINQKIKDEAIRIRKKYSLKLPDSTIISTALFLNIPLISADKEFKKVTEIDLLFFQK